MEQWLLQQLAFVAQLPADAVMVFEQPQWFWLLLLWPLLWWLSHFRNEDDISQAQQSHTLLVKHPFIERFIGQQGVRTKSVWQWRLLAMNVLRGLLLFCLLLALASPVQKIASDSEPQTETVRDIVFVIESSASFVLPDYQLNNQSATRMQVVKSVLDDFIAQLPGNRFGFSIYAENAYSLLPLTADQDLARLTLQRLQPYLAGRTDEAMGEALGLALRATEQDANTTSRKRIVVLISDGLTEQSRVELSEVINYAQLLQVPIYTIGIGAGSDEADKREFTGLLYQPLEEQSLQDLAEQTNAKYYRVGSSEQIGEVLALINQAEGVPFVLPPKPDQRINLYFYPLGLMLLLFAFYAALLLLWSKRSEKTGAQS